MKTHARVRTFLLALAGGLALVVALPGSAFAAPPRALPADADALERRFEPVYDYDTDGCYPTPAIGPDGTLNGGLRPTGSLSGGCRDQSDLDNANGYSRAKCNNGWCGIVYALYFEKDQAVAHIESGHRHDWESVVVWVQDDQAKYVSTSAHGGYTTYSAGRVPWESGTHAKIVYHKDGVSTHAFRLAKAGEQPENHYKAWQYVDLVGWNGYPATWLRDRLGDADWGRANFPLKDANFGRNLEKAKPSGIPFDPYA
ncbi:NPP1 family protein [Streptomyces sp. TRM64462]|uniref:NPP1 family protein n=1 Tax=Streptomyces sp. TRM64462 TaxID=2741726 RepID=UPI0015864BCB|nr:NPP1 family protein [Streptomyces sp. TRM64462]